MTVYNVAIIGLGIMGRRMLTAMTAHDRFHVGGVWDTDPAQFAAATAAGLPVTAAGNAGDLIAAATTDLVYIACPPAHHADYAQAAMTAGKAVLCEKPLGVDLAESQALVSAATATGSVNAVNFSQASSPALTTIQERIAAGATGPLIGADILVHFSRWPRDWQADADWLRFRAEGGFTREVLSHYVFLMERLFGPARLAHAAARYPGDPALCETHMQARFDCAGLPVTFTGTVGGAGPDRVEATVRGEKQSLRIEDWVNLLESDGGPWRPSLPEITDPRAEGVRRQLDNLAALIEGRPSHLPSFADALSVQTHSEAMLAS